MVGWMKMKLGVEVGLCPGYIVLDWDGAPPKGHRRPNFRPMYVGQTTGWIKTPLGTEVGLGTGDILLDGDPAPSQRGIATDFRPMSVGVKRLHGWINMPVPLKIGTEVGLGPGDIV